MLHKIYDALRRGSFPSGIATDPQSGPVANAIGQVFPTSGPADKRTNYAQAWGDTLPSGVAGYAVGALFILINAGANTSSIYQNTGTAASCTFTKVQNSDSITIPGAGTFTSGTGAVALNGTTTVATGKTLAVTDADKLTVGGAIVPQRLELTFRVSLHASTVIYNIFNAPRGYKVTNISYTTNVAQAITATLVKSTVNATPASATTPLHIAGAINANTTIHNGTVVTLTVTAADLVLAATDKIGIVLSGALTTGDFTVNISLQAV